jgi:hypothetical protein
MERRGSIRFLIDAEVDLQFIPDYGFMAAHTNNLSVNGMFIETGIIEILQYRIVQTRIWLQSQYLSRSVVLIGNIVHRSQNGFALHFGRSEMIHDFLINISQNHSSIRQPVSG